MLPIPPIAKEMSICNAKSSFFRGNPPLSLHFQLRIPKIVGVYIAIRSTHPRALSFENIFQTKRPTSVENRPKSVENGLKSVKSRT